jgi:hypothetical protein
MVTTLKQKCDFLNNYNIAHVLDDDIDVDVLEEGSEDGVV